MALLNYIPLLERPGLIWPLKVSEPFKGQILNPFEEELHTYFKGVREKQKILEDLDL